MNFISGLDIPTVELVINHSIPNVPKDYVHRVGRTARAGRHGTSISLVTPSDVHLIHAIEKMINMKLKEYLINGKEQFFWLAKDVEIYSMLKTFFKVLKISLS